jgi:hypothetical protein
VEAALGKLGAGVASYPAEGFARVTIGMTVYTWVEIVTELLATSNDIAGFRTALRPGLATREVLEKTFKEDLSNASVICGKRVIWIA